MKIAGVVAFGLAVGSGASAKTVSLVTAVKQCL